MSFSGRSKALAFDVLFPCIPAVGIAALLSASRHPPTDPLFVTYTVAVSKFVWLFLFPVFLLAEVFTGQSVGKRKMGMILADSDGRYCRPGARFMRWVLRAGPFLMLFVGTALNWITLVNFMTFAVIFGVLSWAILLAIGSRAVHDLLCWTDVVPLSHFDYVPPAQEDKSWVRVRAADAAPAQDLAGDE